jgi:hypothetical protein
VNKTLTRIVTYCINTLMERRPSDFPLDALDEYNLRETLEATQEELIKLMKERELMDWRINKLQNDIVHLAALCRVEVEDPIRQLGLTDAVRWIFAKDRGKSLSVRQVVDELQKSWSDASTYKNLPANVHTVVRRLRKAGDIKPAELPMYPAPLGKIGADEDKYIWGGGLPPLPPRLKEIIKK